MRSAIELCISMQDPDMRSHDDLLSILPWFRRYGKNVLKSASDDILIEILQKCSFHKFNRDNVIISQGELGERFFIVIEGQVSIYVRDPDISNEEQDKRRHSSYETVIRGSLGTRVLVEGEGYSFGEYALMDENGLRKASVIADTNTSLLSIDLHTYGSSLKTLQGDILREREQFINSNTLFSDFSITIKELIKMSLRKVSVSFGENLVIQGDKFIGLIFITSGSGSITIDSSRHETQYPELFPLDFIKFDKRYKEFPELTPSPPTADRSEKECVEDLNPKYIRLKRLRNYAESERQLANQNKHLCTVQSGEIIGDFEQLFDLKTNLFSVTCTDNMTAYVLDTVHIDRLFKRIHTKLFFDRLKEAIRPKLEYREKYFKETPIPLMLFLTTKLYDKAFESIKVFPKMKTDKVLPTIEEERQHLLRMYMENRAPNILPYTRNSVYLKDLMKLNASRRKRFRKKQQRVKEEAVQFTGYSVDSFPISQACIYKLQKQANDSIHFIELIYKEIDKVKIKRPKLEKITFSKTNTKITSNEPSDIHNVDTELELPVLKQGTVLNEEGNDKILSLNSELEEDNLYPFDPILKLQISQIKFLNTLCSDKSRYDIKLQSPKKLSYDSGIRTHFLPTLQPHVDLKKSKNPPKIGAKVLIKSRPCDAIISRYHMVDHCHNTYKVVDKTKENVPKIITDDGDINIDN